MRTKLILWLVAGLMTVTGAARAEELSAADKKAIAESNEFVKRGNEFAEKNSLPRARAEFQKALKIFPKHLDALYNLAVVCEKLNQPDEAIATYKRYLDVRPNDPDVWTQLGVLYDNGGQKAESQAAYEKALAADPDFGRAHHNLGVLLHEQGQLDAAEKHLKTFLELEEKAGRRNSDAFYSLGTLRLSQGNLKEAKSLLQKALDEDPTVTYYNNAMGDVYTAGQEYGAALVCYQKAVAKDEKYAPAYSGMGDAYRLNKEPAKARQAYEKALQLRPDYNLVHFKLGLLFEETDVVAAIKHFQTYLASGKSPQFQEEAKARVEKLKQPKKQ